MSNKAYIKITLEYLGHKNLQDTEVIGLAHNKSDGTIDKEALSESLEQCQKALIEVIEKN